MGAEGLKTWHSSEGRGGGGVGRFPCRFSWAHQVNVAYLCVHVYFMQCHQFNFLTKHLVFVYFSSCHSYILATIIFIWCYGVISIKNVALTYLTLCVCAQYSRPMNEHIFKKHFPMPVNKFIRPISNTHLLY